MSSARTSRFSRLPSMPNEYDSASKQNESVEMHTLDRVADPKHQNTTSSGLKWRAYTTIVFSSCAIPLIALVIWLVLTIPRGNPFTTFAGARIGGRLTQTQAKGVDIVCSALLAPGLMTALDYFWFACARVSAVTEGHGRAAGVPLSALSTMSVSSSGSYDFFHMNALRKGQTYRLGMLTGLVLFSAIARSAFSNIIAYEAYTEPKFTPRAGQLRSLTDSVVQRGARLLTGSSSIAVFGYGTEQQSAVANRIAGLLTGISFSEASSQLTEEAYIHVNATTDSMSSIAATVSSLTAVPGYRLTVDCTPDTPDLFSFVSLSESSSKMSASWSVKVDGGFTSNMFGAGIPGALTEIQSSYNEYYPFAAFYEQNASQVFLSFVYPGFGLINDTVSIPSAYGDIHSLTQNMTGTGWMGTKKTMKIWGVRCWLNRQEGFLDLTHLPSMEWRIDNATFSDMKTRVSSYLAPWQTNLMYRAPQSTVAGIGPALSRSATNQTTQDVDFKAFALNYLYASAEAERAVFEVAATNASRDLPEDFYNVAGEVNEEHYRITYIPIILLVGIIAMLLAASVVSAMAVYASKTLAARSFHEVNALRFLVDSAGGLQHEIRSIADAGLGGGETEKWADGYKVGYESVFVDGEPRLKLRPVSDTSGG
ncbi:hypothetical protein FKW77_007747 [Venturia effusa]|uniref:Uncharacterized protein n=1 Tax=Venturia effusa TaxID=50376 RepID=A0A517LHM1_9PEZI|nr:hypothetical protein FKW77_007747 [Venturia effusa]